MVRRQVIQITMWPGKRSGVVVAILLAAIWHWLRNDAISSIVRILAVRRYPESAKTNSTGYQSSMQRSASHVARNSIANDVAAPWVTDQDAVLEYEPEEAACS